MKATATSFTLAFALAVASPAMAQATQSHAHHATAASADVDVPAAAEAAVAVAERFNSALSSGDLSDDAFLSDVVARLREHPVLARTREMSMAWAAARWLAVIQPFFSISPSAQLRRSSARASTAARCAPVSARAPRPDGSPTTANRAPRIRRTDQGSIAPR